MLPPLLHASNHGDGPRNKAHSIHSYRIWASHKLLEAHLAQNHNQIHKEQPVEDMQELTLVLYEETLQPVQPQLELEQGQEPELELVLELEPDFV
jgi:hypothetical protein